MGLKLQGRHIGLESVTTYILEGVFLLVFAVVLVRFLRRRTRLDADVLAVFAVAAALFAISLVGDFVVLPGWLSTLSAVLLIAQPYLVIRLVRHFAALPRSLELVVLVAFLAAATWLVLGISGNRLGLLYVVGYFVVVEVLGALVFIRAAMARAGTARSRLAIAGIATLLFGSSVLIVGAGAATTAAGEAADPSITAAGRLAALLAGLGYLAAFAPPGWLRRIGHRAVAYRLNEQLLVHPPGTPPAILWGHLASAARNATGSRGALVVGSGPAGELLAEDGDWRQTPALGSSLGRAQGAGSPLGGRHDGSVTGAQVYRSEEGPYPDLAKATTARTTIVVPLLGDDAERARLVLFIPGSPLFVDDDLALLSTLAATTVRAIEREEALAERSSLVASLRETNHELARASAAKSDFLAAMSHELRTPLNSIIGFSELLMAPLPAGDGRRGLDVVDQASHIHGAGLELLDLINEVLDLARVEAGRLELRYDRFDLALLVERTARSMAPLADRRSIDVRIEAQEGLIEGDPGRVRQIVYNLLANAIKFSPEGGIVEVRVTSDDGQATVSVRDEGPGVPASEQALVFEAFGQGQAGRQRMEGSGLGLALARQLAEAHGGSIELVSVPPHGSTFTLRLPARRPQEETGMALGRDRRLVLVIEDDAGSVALLRNWLEPEGYAVRSAADGSEGLELARSLVPDAILLDILLPGVDGWEVLQRLRLEPVTRAIPILVISVVEDQQLGLALGAADYFVKPVDRRLLLDRLRWVTRSRVSDDPPVVLIVDGDTSTHAGYRALLDGSARVVVTPSAAEGHDLAMQSRPDAMLVDLGLEDDPFALLAALRAHPGTRGIPVFALAAQPLSESDKERLTEQVVAVLEKDRVAEGLSSWLMTVPGRARDRAALDGVEVDASSFDRSSPGDGRRQAAALETGRSDDGRGAGGSEEGAREEAREEGARA